jgi:hypothetical protein
MPTTYEPPANNSWKRKVNNMSNAYNFNTIHNGPRATPSKDVIVVPPLPEKLEADVDTLRPLGMAAFIDHFNSDADFRGLLDGYSKQTYQFDKATDNLLATQSFQRYCALQSGPYLAISQLPLKDLLVLFSWLRKQTKTAPATRISIAKREFKNSQTN